MVTGAYKRFPTRFQISKCPSAAPVFDEQVHQRRFFHSTSLFRAPTSSRLIGSPRLAPQRRQSAAALVRPTDSNRKEPIKQRQLRATGSDHIVTKVSCLLDGSNAPPPPARPLERSGWDVGASAIFSSSLGRLASRHSSILQLRTPTIRTLLTCLRCGIDTGL